MTSNDKVVPHVTVLVLSIQLCILNTLFLESILGHLYCQPPQKKMFSFLKTGHDGSIPHPERWSFISLSEFYGFITLWLASYPVGNRGSFPGDKAAGSWSWPPISIWCQAQECVKLYLHSPNTPSWLGAKLKHSDNSTFTRLIFDLGAEEASWFSSHVVTLNSLQQNHHY